MDQPLTRGALALAQTPPSALEVEVIVDEPEIDLTGFARALVAAVLSVEAPVLVSDPFLPDDSPDA